MYLIQWFLKWARAEKDETRSQRWVKFVLAIGLSAMIGNIIENQSGDPGFALGVSVCWVVLWTIVVWKPWRAAPEFDLEKDKEKKD